MDFEDSLRRFSIGIYIMCLADRSILEGVRSCVFLQDIYMYVYMKLYIYGKNKLSNPTIKNIIYMHVLFVINMFVHVFVVLCTMHTRKTKRYANWIAYR